MNKYYYSINNTKISLVIENYHYMAHEHLNSDFILIESTQIDFWNC